MNDIILKVDNINKQYLDFSLKNISFNIRKGTIMGFVGRNGAGKTTTLKAIYQLTKPESGNVYYFDQNIKDNEIEIKNEIGLLFGGIDYFPNKKVKTLTKASKGFYKNWDEDSYRKWLKFFDINEEKRIRELSNGMKVKYNLAIALSHNAKLLLLDEPTSGLDPVSRDELLDIFYRLANTHGVSILFSTHVISDLDKIADDVTYIKNGEIIYTGNLLAFKKSYCKVQGLVSLLSAEQKELIGHYRSKNDYFEGTIKEKDKDYFKNFELQEVNLEDIILHIERGENNEKSPL
ncbi:MAG TPA: ABC transporter ATP-binding protein [Firmicutes bacterium]|nr:ABC transporter ATP-binding protein [Bacillota bacterium]